MKTIDYNIPHSRINAIKFIHQFLDETDVTDKKVVDLSAGRGYVSNLWKSKGAKIEAYDLYPDLMEHDIISKQIDLNKPFPIESNSSDFVLLMETIDHISEQKQLFDEISRILKPNGYLILTKPNNSNISGRMANLWLESERGNMFLPNEKSVIGYDDHRIYMGRIFLIGINKLRTLAGISGLKIAKIYSNQLSFSSIFYFFFIAIFFYLRTFLTLKKVSKNTSEDVKIALKEQYLLNQNPKILFHKHLILLIKKEVL